MSAERRPISKLGGYTRDRQGCLTCRRRKKKCLTSDPAEPRARCTQCRRLNLRCVWEDEQDVAQPRSPGLERRDSDSQSLTLVPLPPPINLLGVGNGNGTMEAPLHRRMALRYYVQSFAGTLSTNAENNGFLSVLLPMAMESGPLLDALIAWSTSHLALQQDSVQVKALEDRSQALRSFASGLHELPKETAVAICLILTSMESTLGNTNDWCHHLNAAASIIKSTLIQQPGGERSKSSFERTSEGRWLLRNFAYHDVLASVSLGRDLLIPDVDWLNEDQSNLIDTYLGLGSAPVSLLGQVNALSRQLADREKEGLPYDSSVVHDVTEELTDLEAQLLAWQPNKNASQPLIALAETYRNAALICLYRVFRYYGLATVEDLKPGIDKQVSLTIEHIAQMPPGCLPECTLLFPLFIAGGETEDPHHQNVIETRLNAIVQHLSFENIRVALVVLKEVWDVKAKTLPRNPSRPYDWTSVLERRRWQLALS